MGQSKGIGRSYGRRTGREWIGTDASCSDLDGRELSWEGQVQREMRGGGGGGLELPRNVAWRFGSRKEPGMVRSRRPSDTNRTPPRIHGTGQAIRRDWPS